MNANKLADELDGFLKEQEQLPWGTKQVYLDQAATMLRQLQKERDLLFNAHSHEMKRADELQIECARLYRIIELNGKIE
jgi:hypothetical protein